MPDTETAGSAPPASTLGPRTRIEPSLAGVGHVVCCTQASHEDLKVIVRGWLEYKANYPAELPAWLDALSPDDQRRLGGWLKTQRPWPGTSLLVAECEACHSTLAVCNACFDGGVVEKGSGPGAYETACDCVYSEEVAA